MNLQCYCFHKSGSLFLQRLFNYIAANNKIDFYTSPYACKGNTNKSNELWNNNLTNCISCPNREPPLNFYENVKYIIHLRNPLDIMISAYYSFGFTHPVNTSKMEIARRTIQKQTIDEYCLSQENIDEINNKYTKLLKWIKKYKNNDNVFISDYDEMYYNFPKWLTDIFNFMSLKPCTKTLSKFKNEFNNCNNEHVKTNLNDIKKTKKHHRSGLSKQYLVELKKETLDLVISKFSDDIRDIFVFK